MKKKWREIKRNRILQIFLGLPFIVVGYFSHKIFMLLKLAGQFQEILIDGEHW